MNDEQYRQHCLGLLEKFASLLQKQSELCSVDDPMRELSAEFNRICDGTDLYQAGPALVARLFASCPDLAPAFPRDLLWFLGGDCLHFMPEEEIANYQQLDEMRWAASNSDNLLDFNEARANLLKLQ